MTDQAPAHILEARLRDRFMYPKIFHRKLDGDRTFFTNWWLWKCPDPDCKELIQGDAPLLVQDRVLIHIFTKHPEYEGVVYPGFRRETEENKIR